MDIGSVMNVTYRTVLMAFLWKKKRLRKYLKRMDTVLLLLVSGIWEVGMNNILIIVDLICFTV